MTDEAGRPQAGDRPDLARHAAKCKICSHPRRAEIEADFIRWESTTQIAKDYELANRASVYRYARAIGLFGRRSRNLGAVLVRMIERADEIEPNGSTIIAAIYACTKLMNARNDIGEVWRYKPPDDFEDYPDSD